MSLLHHWEDEDEVSYEDLRDSCIREVEEDSMASLNEIRNIHNDDDFLTAEEFCKKYDLK